MFYVVDLDQYIIVIIGEFGIVHRAHLVKNSLQSVTTIPVAVKMMKGIGYSQWVYCAIRYCYSHYSYLKLWFTKTIIMSFCFE